MNEKIKQVGGYQINFNKYLGGGSFSLVYECEKKNRKYAVKIVDRFNPNIDPEVIEQAVARQAANAMKLLAKNILFLHQHIATKNNHYLIYECCQTDLFDMIKTILSQKMAIPLVAQIMNGYRYFYYQNILHRDLKPNNILCKKGVLKIADFGSSKNMNTEDNRQTRQVGSPGYMAPEVLHSENYDYKADLWSIGAIFYELLHGRVPSAIRGPNWLRKDLSPETKNFLTCCLEVDPINRISFQQMESHKIFYDYPVQSGRAELIVREVFKSLKPEEDLKYILSQIKQDFLDIHEFSRIFKETVLCQVDKPSLDLIYRYFQNNEDKILTEDLRKTFLLVSSQIHKNHN